MSNIPFEAIDWKAVPKVEFPGEMGTSIWQTIQFEGLRVRIVKYKKGYLADHWCKKGHIVHCLKGEFITELENGDKITFRKGMTFVVSDNLSSHLSISENGAKLLIIDGDFLSNKID
jgi:quercetin dioxygenase-like cupin family protein